jgi:hypothetical protein
MNCRKRLEGEETKDQTVIVEQGREPRNQFQEVYEAVGAIIIGVVLTGKGRGGFKVGASRRPGAHSVH